MAIYKGLDDGLWHHVDTKEVVWSGDKGRVFKISDMSTEHIRNCVAVIFTRDDGWRSGYMQIFTEELKRRRDHDDVGPAESTPYSGTASDL